MVLDNTDRLITAMLEKGLPLEARPFQKIGKFVGLDEAETLVRLARLRQAGIFSWIGPVINPKPLAHTKLFVGCRVKPIHLSGLLQELWANRAVYALYQTKGIWNLWFQSAFPKEVSWEDWLDALKAQFQGEVEFVVLRPLKVLKPIAGEANFATGSLGAQRAFELRLEEIEARVLDALQGGIPLIERPFQKLAQSLGISEARFQECIRRLIEHQVILKCIPFQEERVVQKIRERLERPEAFLNVPEEWCERWEKVWAQDKDVCFAIIQEKTRIFPFSLHVGFASPEAMEAFFSRYGKAWPSYVVDRKQVLQVRAVRYFCPELWRFSNSRASSKDKEDELKKG